MYLVPFIHLIGKINYVAPSLHPSYKNGNLRLQLLAFISMTRVSIAYTSML
jgi:hypothetical protein